MSTSLPNTLLEYLTVWCGDLLQRLRDEERAWLLDNVLLTYEGRPWPARLTVQRLAEIVAGDVNAALVQGESAACEEDIELVVERLAEPSTRQRAIVDLAGMQPVGPLFASVDAATREGLLSKEERSWILSRSLRQPYLPEPIPDPMGRPPLPPGYPKGLARAGATPAGHRVPAMERYTPQRGLVSAPVVPSEAAGAWAPMRRLEVAQDTAEREMQRHDGADTFLRARGWASRRDLTHGECEHDEWTWPPSDERPWWQPTIIDYDGRQFRVRLACANLAEPPRTAQIESFEQLRRAVARIEAWTRRDPTTGPER